jgi:uridylate kinase
MPMLYQKVLLKLSGEALVTPEASGLTSSLLFAIADDIITLTQQGVRVAIVVGGGNFLRGRDLQSSGIRAVTADHMGMLATLMNGLALQEAFLLRHQKVSLMSAISIQHSMIETFSLTRALTLWDAGTVLIFSGGTGNPFVTTDSAASLRAIELGADILLKGTHVDGVYSADPYQNAQATLYPRLSYDEVLAKKLGVMDAMAFQQCQSHCMPVRVFNIRTPHALLNVLQDDTIGTYVGN